MNLGAMATPNSEGKYFNGQVEALINTNEFNVNTFFLPWCVFICQYFVKVYNFCFFGKLNFHCKKTTKHKVQEDTRVTRNQTP